MAKTNKVADALKTIADALTGDKADTATKTPSVKYSVVTESFEQYEGGRYLTREELKKRINEGGKVTKRPVDVSLKFYDSLEDAQTVVKYNELTRGAYSTDTFINTYKIYKQEEVQ